MSESQRHLKPAAIFYRFRCLPCGYSRDFRDSGDLPAKCPSCGEEPGRRAIVASKYPFKPQLDMSDRRH